MTIHTLRTIILAFDRSYNSRRSTSRDRFGLLVTASPKSMSEEVLRYYFPEVLLIILVSVLPAYAKSARTWSPCSSPRESGQMCWRHPQESPSSAPNCATTTTRCTCRFHTASPILHGAMIPVLFPTLAGHHVNLAATWASTGMVANPARGQLNKEN